MSDKRSIRTEMRAKRDAFVNALPKSERNRYFSVLPSELVAIIKDRPVVAGYMAYGSEADCLPLLSAAREAGCDIALPYIGNRKAPMVFRRWRHDVMTETGTFGLRQPPANAREIRPDVVLMPLVAFDRSLNRLGQGGGHYDRALCDLTDALRIGIAWSAQECARLPTDSWDVPMHHLLTEREWISR